METDDRRMGMRVGLAAAGIALAIGLAGLPAPSVGNEAEGVEEPDPAALKAAWQARYRELRMKEAQLIQTIELATKEYADSNRRTYRRSGVRHFHRTNAIEARDQLAVVRTKIERMFEEVVAAGGSLNWLYEVDDDPIDPSSVSGLGDYGDDGRFGGKGAYGSEDTSGEAAEARDADADAEEEDPDAGRNPLYTREVEDEGGSEAGDPEMGDPEAGADADEVPASLEEKPRPGFDYDSWRKDRRAYEAERARERHLVPGDD